MCSPRSSCGEAPHSTVDSGFEWNFTHLLTPAHLKKTHSKADFIKVGGSANKSRRIQDNTFKEHMSHGKSSRSRCEQVGVAKWICSNLSVCFRLQGWSLAADASMTYETFLSLSCRQRLGGYLKRAYGLRARRVFVHTRLKPTRRMRSGSVLH